MGLSRWIVMQNFCSLVYVTIPLVRRLVKRSRRYVECQNQSQFGQRNVRRKRCENVLLKIGVDLEIVVRKVIRYALVEMTEKYISTSYIHILRLWPLVTIQNFSSWFSTRLLVLIRHLRYTLIWSLKRTSMKIEFDHSCNTKWKCS